MEPLLQALIDRLRKAYGDDLISVILYGSAAEREEYDRDYSDINVLCVLNQVTPRELAFAAPVFRWWKEHAAPPPLLIGEGELARSADCFAIEFHDMQSRRRVLHGRDVIAELTIRDSFYRVQIEYELRTKLLRLRQKAVGILGDRNLVTRILLDSVTTFSVLTRHALALGGVTIPEPAARRQVWQQARDRFGIDPRPFEALLDVREKKIKAGAIQPERLLANYLQQIGKIVDAVDAMDRPGMGGT